MSNEKYGTGDHREVEWHTVRREAAARHHQYFISPVTQYLLTRPVFRIYGINNGTLYRNLVTSFWGGELGHGFSMFNFNLVWTSNLHSTDTTINFRNVSYSCYTMLSPCFIYERHCCVTCLDSKSGMIILWDLRWRCSSRH